MNVKTHRVWSLVTAMALTGLVATAAFAQDDDEDEERILEEGKWYPSLEAGFNLTQSAYSDNWNGGDAGSIVWTFLMNATAENQLSEKVNFLNVARLAFGQTHRQETSGGGRSWDRPEKSTDTIFYDGTFRFTLGAFADPYASIGLTSQFQDATDPFGRTLSINPITFRQGAGMAKQFINREHKQLVSRLGFSVRENLRNVFVETAPSEATELATSIDGGVEWITDYSTRVFEDRVSWTSRFSVYQPLFYSAKNDFDDILASDFDSFGIDRDVKDFTTEANASWENLFSTQITKLISVNLFLEWMYDKYDATVAPVFNDDGTLANGAAVSTGIRKKGQFKQTLALGLTYRFF